MARDNIPEYSATASANTVVADVNIDEGCAPSGINNAIREVMAALKDVDTGATTLTSPAFTSSTSASIKTATVKHTNDTTSMTIATNGGVTFSQVPSFPDNTVETADVQDNAITLAKMAGLTRGSIIYGNANGDPTELAVGTGVLTGNGTDLSFAGAASSSTGFFLNALQKNIAARTGGVDIVVDALLDESGIAVIDEAGYVSGTLTLSTAGTTHPDPAMTSNTAPSPYVASAQYTGGSSSGFFYRAWLSNSGYFDNYTSTTQWIQLDIGSAKVATAYKMATSITGTYNTTSHTFTGSNSADGSNSTTLATNSSASNTFRSFSNSTAFRYYRINATGNGGFGTGQVWQNNALQTTKSYPFNIETVSYATGSVKTSVTVGVYATTTGSENLNTTLKALVSRDGGSNYTTSSTLSLKTTTPDGKKYFQADDVDISGIASGTNLKLKIVVTNNTCTALHGWVLDWS